MKQHFTIRIAIFLFCFFFVNSLVSQSFVPGNVYFDNTGYVEYRAGDLPVIISVPHGGDLEPASIPDRSSGSLVKDSWTKTIGEGLYDAFYQQTGCYPHLIINLLHRKKFDANRDIAEAAEGNPTVEQAWHGYHAFIDSSKIQITTDYGRGLFLDIHGHAHTIQRIELGYLLSASELQLDDASLNTITYIEESSIRSLTTNNIGNLSHSELLRGEDSFGTMLDDKGFPAVPSFSDPFPDIGEPYFSGGYNTARHGSRDNAGNIDAIQLELNQDVRFNSVNRAKLIDSLTSVTNEYLDTHFNDQYIGNFCNLILPVELAEFKVSKQKQEVILSWKTVTETNNHYFEIQRSTLDNRFVVIGKLEGRNNSEEPNLYQFIDAKPNVGNNYYRLKQVDKDGAFTYSEIKQVNFTAGEEYILSPNPSKNENIKLSYYATKKKELTVTVYDISGKAILQQIHISELGENELRIKSSDFTSGMYILTVEDSHGVHVQRFAVAK